MNQSLTEMFEEIQLPLLQELIRQHPVYGSSGQQACAMLIQRTLAESGWDASAVDQYTASELVDEPDYVPVSEFGDAYSGDIDKPKLNVYGCIDSGFEGPTLILNGHYDVDIVSDSQLWTVENGWKSGLIANGKIYGRGSTDMLGGLTSLIALGSLFARSKNSWKGKIVLCAVTDEEIGGNGTIRSFKTLEKLGYLANDEIYGLIAEPTGDIIAEESLGFMHMRLRAIREPRHMGTAKRINNSLYDMIDVITDFDEITDAVLNSLKGQSGSKLIHNFGVIGGGQDAAIPIGETHAEATVFYPADIAKNGLELALGAQLRSRYEGIVSAEFSDFGFRGHKSSENRLAATLLGTSPAEGVSSGTFNSPCDARIFATYGIPDVTIFGPGRLENAHSVNEHIELRLLQEYNQHLMRAISELLKR